jgi:two-component system chemotaxis response regulator CheB
MSIRVLIIDDSGFFRRRLTEIFSTDPELEIVGTAADGQEGVRQLMALQPDVVTMDIEMPVMDGISAVREIMTTRPTPILMFSSLTSEGAKATLEALAAGAMDFLPKRFRDICEDPERMRQTLCARVRMLAKAPLPRSKIEVVQVQSDKAASALSAVVRRDLRLIVIGASTGGPVALQEVITQLPANFPVPILLIQHMPASFTPAFAERLNKLAAIHVSEAQDGGSLAAGAVLLAPGGQQLTVTERGGRLKAHVFQETAAQVHYRPSLDITFASAAHVCSGQVLGVILTGMGSDGCEGARLIRQAGGNIWAQDEASCVVYGMPAAVVRAGLAERVLPLTQIGPAILASMR